jgi:hypothetical protein
LSPARRRTHVVAQIVETELVVGPVGDVAGVGFLTLQSRHVALNRPHGQAQSHVQRSHPLHVAAGQVVVHRHDMDAFAFDRVQIGGQRRHQRLAFARHHLGDRAAVQHHAADQLDVVVPHPEEPAAALAAQSKRFDQQIVQRLASPQPLAELHRLLAQLGVAHRLVLRLQHVDRLDPRLQLLDITGIGRAEHRGDGAFETTQHPPEEQAGQFPSTFQSFHWFIRSCAVIFLVFRNTDVWASSPNSDFTDSGSRVSRFPRIGTRRAALRARCATS